MVEPTRRALLSGVSGLAVVGLVGCSSDSSTAPAPESTPSTEPPPTVLTRTPAASSATSGDAATLAAAVCGLLVEKSRVAVLAPHEPAALETATSLARTGRWPVLIGGGGEGLPPATLAELPRLGVEYVIVVGEDDQGQLEGALRAVPALAEVTLETVVVGPDPATPDGVPVGETRDPVAAFVVTGAGTDSTAAAATAGAFGVAAHTDLDDPRESATAMSSLRERPDAPVVALAADPDGAQRLLVEATMAQRAPELPGGGVTVFPHRRMIALYGHPGVPVLGLLGEQGIDASITRVAEYVDRYQPLVSETVIPAFEIIASVATAAAGPDQSYSKVWPRELFRPWVDAAREAGVYVVLDLQPGRTDFLSQAKAYEELLVEPHVGLALDPEWRLGPNEKHLVRIGSVTAAEINAVSDWLAELVRTHDLPQKVLTLHQFRLSMIEDRASVRTDHPELAVVLHADGQGPQGAKQETWKVLKADLPEGMWLGWKNFYDEDSPMLTPEQTVSQVDPIPWFVSYQ